MSILKKEVTFTRNCKVQLPQGNGYKEVEIEAEFKVTARDGDGLRTDREVLDDSLVGVKVLGGGEGDEGTPEEVAEDCKNHDVFRNALVQLYLRETAKGIEQGNSKRLPRR